MKLSELAKAIQLEIGVMPIVDIIQRINSFSVNISEAIKLNKRYDLTILDYTGAVDSIFDIPDETALSEGECYDKYNSLKIPESMRKVKVFIDNTKLRLTNQQDSYKTTTDGITLLPFYYDDSRRIFFTGAIDIKWSIYLYGMYIFPQIPENSTQHLELEYPADVKQYVANLIAFRYYSSKGDWSRGGHYRKEMEREKIRLASRLNARYADNRGA